MKQFGTILKFELKNYLVNKAFMGVTIFLMVAIAAVMFAPRVIDAIRGEDPQPEGVPPIYEAGGTEEGATAVEDDDRPVLLLVAEQQEDSLHQAFSAAFPEYAVQLCREGTEEIRRQITRGEAECAFVLDGLLSYTYYVDDLSMYDSNTAVADALLQNMYQMDTMLAGGLSAEQAQQVLSVNISHSVEKLGKDQIQNFFYTYIMIFALYMVILLYGQMVASNVATEKSSRAMEVLITSAKPVSMMFGKVLASCLAGFFQLLAIFGTAVLCFNINREYWDAFGMIAAFFDVPAGLLAYMLLFFVLGFLIYAFLFGAVGSTASKLEDINTSVMPIMLLFVAGFLVTVMALAEGNVDTLLMKICSFVPFTSPMAMFTRIAMSTVPPVEIALSVGLLVAAAVGVGVISAKIYRVGVLLYGTPPKLGAILRAVTRG